MFLAVSSFCARALGLLVAALRWDYLWWGRISIHQLLHLSSGLRRRFQSGVKALIAEFFPCSHNFVESRPCRNCLAANVLYETREP
jgi:hypothetical protein